MKMSPVIKLSKAEYAELTASKHKKMRNPMSIYRITCDLKPGEAFHVETPKARPPSQVYQAARESNFRVTMRHGANRVGQEGYWVIRTVA